MPDAGLQGLLPMWLDHNAKEHRKRASLARARLAGFAQPPATTYAKSLQTLAECHEAAAEVYEAAMPEGVKP